jgi:hypothetical protein
MNQDEDPRDQQFAQRTRALLDRSAAALSAQTRSRLRRARYAALEHYPLRSRWQRWLPAGAVAATVLAVLLLVGRNPAPEPQLASATGGEDLELLADRDALALAQDQPVQDGDVDYEFYAWAVTAAQDEGGGEAGS